MIMTYMHKSIEFKPILVYFAYSSDIPVSK